MTTRIQANLMEGSQALWDGLAGDRRAGVIDLQVCVASEPSSHPS